MRNQLTCWICNGEEDHDELDFDMEYDCFYHTKCLDETDYDSIVAYEKNTEGEHLLV